MAEALRGRGGKSAGRPERRRHSTRVAAYRLLDHPAQVINSITSPEAPILERLQADARQLANATLAHAAESGDQRFRKLQAQINQWAEDKITSAENELDLIKREIKQARKDADLAQNLQERHAAEQRVQQLEQKQRRQRKAIFEVEDEIEERRKQYIGELKNRMNQKSSVQHLFTIRWSAR